MPLPHLSNELRQASNCKPTNPCLLGMKPKWIFRCPGSPRVLGCDTRPGEAPAADGGLDLVVCLGPAVEWKERGGGGEQYHR